MIPASTLDLLRSALSSDHVLTDPASLKNWGVDWTRSYTVAPSAIVFPQSVDEVVAVVKLANSHNFEIVPSGGRTGMSGGAVASSGEVVVSMDRMNRILRFNATDRLVTCQAGVITQELQEYAKSQGLFYPVNFAAAGSSHVGGNVATNAGGIRVIRYGMTRDWIGGLRVVTGAGELLDCNAGLIKNATGYDLRHLFIGSEGTLGIIVEVDFRLAPLPAQQSVMVLGVADFRDILHTLERFQGHVELSAFEFFSHGSMEHVLTSRSLQAPLEEPSPYYALLEFDESAGQEALEAFEGCLEEGWVNDGAISQSPTQAKALWALREGIPESIAPRTPYKNDIAVRPSEMAGLLEATDALVKDVYPDFEICWYGHIGDGNLHLNILCPEEMDRGEFYKKCHAASPQIFELVQARGGSISAEHGVGLLKKDHLHYSRSDADIRLMKGLRSVFDPKGVLNPGKLF